MSVALAAVLAAPTLVASPQQMPEPGQAPPAFSTGAQAVVLDIVAHDKKGRTVGDLRPEEIEVLEEGQPKAIVRFRFVERAPFPSPAAPGAAGAAPNPETIRHPTLVTLVFDALDQEGRAFAQNAALELLKIENRPDLFFSVFSIGNRLQLLQQFTTDRPAVAAAVERACSVLDPRGVVPGAEATDRATAAANAATERAQAANEAALAGGGAGAGAAAGLAAVEAGMANMELRAVEMAQSLERSQRGNSSLFGLFALARQQQRLAGRKAIVYFSEGLEVPNQLEPLYRSVVSESNRANLSVYSIDARGLLTTSDNESAKRDLRKSMETVRRQVQSRGGRAVTREDVLAAEVAEDAITLNVQGMLGALAESTGGRLIANSNDVRAGLERALADLAGYYEVTYDPQLTAFDGTFRRVRVKVKRAGVTLQTREGYFALPPGEGSVDFPWELPLLEALKDSPAPRDFQTRAVTYHFGPEHEGLRHTLVAEIPLEGLRFDGGGGTRKAHFSVLAVVRDARGVVREHFSQDSPVEVPEKSLEALRRGNAVFTRSFTVPSGRYGVELAVLDRAAKRTSVRKSVLVVAPPHPGLTLSSLAVVKRIENVPEGALDSSDPLRNGSSRIVARAEPGLPPPDTEGRIPYVVSVPTESLAPGRYEVSAVVRLGETASRERTFFTIAEPSAPGN